MRNSSIQNRYATRAYESSIAMVYFMTLMLIIFINALCETKMGAQRKIDTLENKANLALCRAIPG